MKRVFIRQTQMDFIVLGALSVIGREWTTQHVATSLEDNEQQWRDTCPGIMKDFKTSVGGSLSRLTLNKRGIIKLGKIDRKTIYKKADNFSIVYWAVARELYEDLEIEVYNIEDIEKDEQWTPEYSMTDNKNLFLTKEQIEEIIYLHHI